MTKDYDLELYPGTDFHANQDLIESILEYARPPHEPVPAIEGIDEETRAYLASEAGIVAVKRWSQTFDKTLQRLFDYKINGEPLAMSKVVNFQRILLGGLIKRLEGHATDTF